MTKYNAENGTGREARVRSLLPIGVLLVGIAIGALATILFAGWAKPTGWILEARSLDTGQFTVSELRVVRDLIANGSVVSPSELMDSFINYYHFLVSVLVTLLVALAGVVTIRYFVSRTEYNERMKQELDRFLLDYGNQADHGDWERYERLQDWVTETFENILETSEADIRGLVTEMAALDLVSNDEFVDAIVRKLKEERLPEED